VVKRSNRKAYIIVIIHSPLKNRHKNIPPKNELWRKRNEIIAKSALHIEDPNLKSVQEL